MISDDSNLGSKSPVGGEAWGDKYVDAAVPFMFTGARINITIRHDSFLLGSRFVEGGRQAAQLTIVYRPSDKILEWVLLGEFLDQFALEPTSLEQAGEKIYAHITKTVAPSMLRVELRRVDGPSQTTFTAIFE